MIKIGVLGARGRMGSLVCQTIRDADDTELVAEVDLGNLLDPLEGCEVVIDFTSPLAVMGNLRWCLQHGRDMVIGTSGFDASRLAEVTEIITQTASESEMPESKRPRILVVPNFSVGAVLMMKFAEQAARFFESAEIIELHHAGQGRRAVRHRGPHGGDDQGRPGLGRTRSEPGRHDDPDPGRTRRDGR